MRAPAAFAKKYAASDMQPIFGAVSYTHLDVYKRQIQRRAVTEHIPGRRAGKTARGRRACGQQTCAAGARRVPHSRRRLRRDGTGICPGRAARQLPRRARTCIRPGRMSAGPSTQCGRDRTSDRSIMEQHKKRLRLRRTLRRSCLCQQLFSAGADTLFSPIRVP